jgi:hypothetical protein
VHDRRLVARIDQFGDVLRQAENLELARRQFPARRELRQRVAPCAVRLAATKVQRRRAALQSQALANLLVLLDVVLVKILDDVVEPIDRHRLAALHQRVGEMEGLVVRIVAEHPDVGIAHQPVAHLDRRHQLGQHRPFGGDVRENHDARCVRASALRPQPLVAFATGEAIDHAIAVRFVLGGGRFKKLVQADPRQPLGRCARQLQEGVVGSADIPALIDARRSQPKRSKLLEQRLGVDSREFWQGQKPLGEKSSKCPGNPSQTHVNAAFPKWLESSPLPGFKGFSA